MTKTRIRVRVAVAAAAAIAVTAIAPGSALAYADGETCNVGGPTPVYARASTTSTLLYTIPSGGAFKIAAGATANAAWLYGNGLGQPAGYIEQGHINRGTCHL